MNYYTQERRNSITVRKSLYASDFMPFVCAAATFKYAYTYYGFAVPALSGICDVIYQVITLFFLMAFIPLCFIVIKKANRMYAPIFIIVLMVLLNIVYVMLSTGSISIISRSYHMSAASGTNDYTGFYFSQINTWFGNMAIVLFLMHYVRDREMLIKCIVSSMVVLIIPIVLITALHPSYLGTRESVYNNDTVFGGGLWNIGVIGFGSLSWIGLALSDDARKKQKWIIYISVALFVFVGVAGVSRTLILMVAFSTIVFLMFTKKDMSWVGRSFLILAAIVLFFILEPEFILSVMERFSDKTSGTHNVRILLWKAYLSHFKEFWLIGAPEGSVYNYYRDVNYFGEHFLPHSSLINFFVRYGIFALCAYVTLLKNSFLKIQKSTDVTRKSRICILAGGVAYITLAFINQTGYAESVFFVMFGLYLAFYRIATYYEG